MCEKRNDAYYDSLVNGYNEKWIQDQYENLRRQPREQKYMLIDMNIKSFRLFNILYGHKAGDEILKTVYQTVAEYLNEDEWIAHVYADTFLLLMKYDDFKVFEEQRIEELTDTMYRIKSDARIYRNIFASFGIYRLDDEDCDFHEAVENANLCRVSCDSLHCRSYSYEVFDQSVLKNYRRHCELEIQTAEAYKNYEFISFLQPKVDAHTHQIVGAEALVRWYGPDGKLVPVSDFLPILNQNSYIILVDMDVFDLVCRMLDGRIKANKPVVPISFNLSKAHFYDPALIKDYTDILDKYEIPRELIVFELMETITLDDTEKMKSVISQLRSEGFSCSLDDFGNGYSSFTVLLNADLDSVKMDRQFFLPNLNGDSKLIIKTVVQLIKSLGMKVIAEGVETREHADFLDACGCDQIQGFYFYKPMPIGDFEALLDENS